MEKGKAVPEGKTNFAPGQNAGGMTVKVNLRAIDFAIMQKLMKADKMKDPQEITAVGFIKELNTIYKDTFGEDASLTVGEIETLFNEYMEGVQKQMREDAIMDKSIPTSPQIPPLKL